MNYSSTGTLSDITISQDSEGATWFLKVLKIGEEGLVGQAFQLLALHLAQDCVLVLILEQLADPRLHHDVNHILLVVLQLDVDQIRMDTKSSPLKVVN